MKRSTSIIIAVLLAIVIFFGIFFISKKNAKIDPYNKQSISMGTVITESIYFDKASDDSLEEIATKVLSVINDLDAAKLSWRIKNSDVYNLNTNFNATVSPVTAECIKTCLEVSKKSNGLFDITVGDLTTLWGIGTEDAKVPTPEEITEAISKIDYKKVKLLGNDISIENGQKVDLGAVGKGLACDESFKYLKTTNTQGAVISVGGSLLIYGQNPNDENGTWNVGIRNPFGHATESAGLISLRNASPKGAIFVSTSGDYEKTLTVDGKTYHHILNPKTGYPAESNVTGVTVVSSSGILSDALSTACFSLGYGKESIALLKEYNSEAVFILKDKTVYVTDGIKNDVTFTDGFEVTK